MSSSFKNCGMYAQDKSRTHRLDHVEDALSQLSQIFKYCFCQSPRCHCLWRAFSALHNYSLKSQLFYLTTHKSTVKSNHYFRKDGFHKSVSISKKSCTWLFTSDWSPGLLKERLQQKTITYKQQVRRLIWDKTTLMHGLHLWLHRGGLECCCLVSRMADMSRARGRTLLIRIGPEMTTFHLACLHSSPGTKPEFPPHTPHSNYISSTRFCTTVITVNIYDRPLPSLQWRWGHY